jgi:O-antigen ligase
MRLSNDLANANRYLLIVLGFAMAVSVSIGTIVAVVIAILWICSGNFAARIEEIKNNKVALAFLAFYLLHIVGLAWTEDLKWGLHMAGKEWKILMLPVLMTAMKKEDSEYYLTAFIAAMTFAHVVSYLNILEITKFTVMGHVFYNVLLAVCIYFILDKLVFYKLSKSLLIIYSILFISMSINMFITIGRTGQIIYFVSLIIILFQFFESKIARSISLSILLIPILFFTIYYTSNVFKNRIDAVVDEVTTFKMNRPSKYVNDRITFYINTLNIIKNNLLLGVGTGDFSKEYNKVNQLQTPDVVTTVNPHNNYLLVMAQFGILGLLIFLSIFYFQIRCALATSDLSRHNKLALPIIFMTAMFTDSYLLGHFTSLSFVYFSAFLYKDCNTFQENRRWHIESA